MHFEFLVEDKSGSKLLEAVLDKILGPDGNPHTRKIISYKGVGRLPTNLQGTLDPERRILLDRLPKLLRGYGRSLAHTDAAVVVVVDLDSRDCIAFKQELLDVLNQCNPRPRTLFRIAIEEMEAWMLGDRDAIRSAYPYADHRVLDRYRQDDICGTWEVLADALYPGGSRKLKRLGYPPIGKEKFQWAENIGPLIDIDANRSKSFQVFRDGILRLVGNAP